MTHAYCTSADVQSRIGKIFTLTTSSQPSIAQVEEWIQQKSGKLDGALKRAGYATVPPTAVHDLLQIKDMVANAVALMAIVAGTYNVTEAQIAALSGWNEYIRDLSRGIIFLPDQSPVRNSIQVIRASVYK